MKVPKEEAASISTENEEKFLGKFDEEIKP